MVSVIEADANELGRARNRRQKGYVRKREDGAGRGFINPIVHFGASFRTTGEHCNEIGKTCTRQGHDAVFDQDARLGGTAGVLKREKSHVYPKGLSHAAEQRVNRYLGNRHRSDESQK